MEPSCLLVYNRKCSVLKRLCFFRELVNNKKHLRNV